jgi:hypothetical protein
MVRQPQCDLGKCEQQSDQDCVRDEKHAVGNARCSRRPLRGGNERRGRGQCLKSRGYDVVISNVRLPGIDGPALYAWMAEHKPQLCARTAFVTGDTLGQASERFLAGARRPLLEKPSDA